VHHLVLKLIESKAIAHNHQMKSGDPTQAMFYKEVIERGDEQYLHFNQDTATQSTDIIGKHLYEFKQYPGSAKDDVPEIFVLLVSYFEV
jgi:hypothetical protein